MAVLHPQPYIHQHRPKPRSIIWMAAPYRARVPLRLVFSYILDWFVILGIAAIGAVFWHLPPNRRPFSPVDPSLSYPYVLREKVSTAVLAIVSSVIPAVLTAAIALLTTPTAKKSSTTSSAWLQRCWALNTAWLGLGLALALTFLFTEGLKDIMGKPRPDLLARCDLDPTLVKNYVVGGGLGEGLPAWNALVSWTACRQIDGEVLGDGFQSFPSGHSSFSWCGMFYLFLFLCAKFRVAIPYLLPDDYTLDDNDAFDSRNKEYRESSSTSNPNHHQLYQQPSHHITPRRNSAAAPPAYLFILALIPVSIATYISSTRYSDFRHYGFDIIFGSLMGILFAWGGFRMYHLPLQRGGGWAWGPRSVRRAWGIRMGTVGYAGDDSCDGREDEVRGTSEGQGDVEMGFARGVNVFANGSTTEGTAIGGKSMKGDATTDPDRLDTPLRQPSRGSRKSGLPPPPIASRHSLVLAPSTSRRSARETRLQKPNGHNRVSDNLHSL